MKNFNGTIETLQELNRKVDLITNIGKEEIEAIDRIQKALNDNVKEAEDIINRIKL